MAGYAGQNRLIPVPVELAHWVREYHRAGPCEVGTHCSTTRSHSALGVTVVGGAHPLGAAFSLPSRYCATQ